MLPPNDKLAICFAHVAYRMHERFSALNTGINSFAVRDSETLENRVGEVDVLVISGLWHDGLLDRAKNLRFIQAIGAGTDQFPREELAKRSIRLASAHGVNYRAVAEHAMALILALSRRLPEARDNQAKRVWRGMIGDPDQREDELGGKTLLVVGLTCPLAKETEKLVDTQALGLMKHSAHLVNVARGRVVDEVALVEALAARRIAGAGIDVTTEEPLAASSPLWGMEHVLITPHTAGETRHYEDNVIEILRDNLGRLWRGEEQLRNQVV
jgi:phosphoglycerate dehydrogenase-like enzyme